MFARELREACRKVAIKGNIFAGELQEVFARELREACKKIAIKGNIFARGLREAFAATLPQLKGCKRT